MNEQLPLTEPAEDLPAIDFQAQLNPAQYEAVTTLDGPILVVAGAGSGKTRTLVYRVAYLVEQGIPPESILLLTFTRKAASEMLSRAGQLVGARCAQVSGGTFHSLANELLRSWAGALGFRNSFGIMDRGDMEEVLGQLRKDLGLGQRDRSFPKRSTLATIVSKAANKSEDLDQVILNEYVHLKKYMANLVHLAKDYATFKQENALMDFDDLLIQLNRLLKEDARAKEKIAAKYQYIMVDEYQDTNPVQAEIVSHLGAGHRNVMVVGDDAQSIYSFRGASFKNIMDFPKVFSEARVIRLEENYRSRQPILDLTNHIISRARERYDKRLFTRKTGGQKPVVMEVGTQMEQSLFVCSKIRELMAHGVDPSEMAVLFRAARHSFKLEVELARHNIDFVKYGGRRFLEAAHIKDLLSLLRTVANPTDSVSLTRSLLLLNGVGPKRAAEITTWIAGRREQLLSLGDFPGRTKIKDSLKPLGGLFGRIAVKGVGMHERIDGAWGFYRPFMEAKFDDHPNRLKDVNEFLSMANSYTSLARFLADMALDPPNASGNPARDGDPQGRLILSTVHSSKGLEWKAVFIIWATEGRFPPAFALNSPEDLDEERRLMYVAATRAEDELFIISPLESEFEGGLQTPPRLSRFLADVPFELLGGGKEEEPAPPPVRPKSGAGRQENGAAGFGPRSRVSHPVFGLGRVVKQMNGRKIIVDFDHYGTKTLHLDYAGLKNAGG